MAATTVIHIQELCDQIVEFLGSSDLPASALISQSFAVAVRPRIFGDVVVPTPEKPGCKLLLAVLETSSHLTFLIRRLHVRLEQTVLMRLYALHMPNLQELTLSGHPRRRSAAKAVAFRAAANLLSLPTIRRVCLVSLGFRHMYDLDRLFDRCTTELHLLVLDTVSILSHGGLPISSPQRIRTKSLRLRSPVSDWIIEGPFTWLAHPMCPFDLTGLHDLDYDGTSLFYDISRFPLLSRSTLKNITISTNFWAFDRGSPRMSFGELPALRHLTLNTTSEYMRTKLGSVAAAFRSDCLLHLVVNVICSTVPQTHSGDIVGVALRRLMDIVTQVAFPSLRSIELNMTPELFEASISWAEVERQARATLVNWDMIGKLRVGQLCACGIFIVRIPRMVGLLMKIVY
ncbi:hypothetical protein DFH06DRAFT_1467290 [Mycena polygramma]|nr:hypothetical protein DFH06DRAFT_1467290 [Mycena polygramma]